MEHTQQTDNATAPVAYRIEMYNRRKEQWQPYPDAAQPPMLRDEADLVYREYQATLERAQLRVAEIPSAQAGSARHTQVAR